MKRVLMDCDGVLADFIGAYLEVINGYQKTSISREDITEWSIAKSLGWSDRQARCADRLISEYDGFASHIGVCDSAIDGMLRLREIADVYVVTAPWWSHRTWVKDRNDWLYRHFGIPASKTIHTSAKHVCAGDVLVDDRTDTLVTWQAAHPAGIAVQWSTPHNRHDAWDGRSTSSWDALIEIVENA